MEKERNPNFVYLYSELFQQEMAMSKKTGDVTFKDGVKFTSAELALVDAAGGVITLADHRVKKLIGGEIVECKRKGADNATHSSAEAANLFKNGKSNEGKQLEIF